MISRAATLAGLALVLTAAQPAGAQEAPKVVEIGRSYDLERRESFLSVTVEFRGLDPTRTSRLQPLREHFTLVAGKQRLPCLRLRGGTLPEDPMRLRFNLGFAEPPAGIRVVSLAVRLPRADVDDALEVKLDALAPGDRRGDGWSLAVQVFGPDTYTPPVLPPRGEFISKGGPSDVRVFRKGTGDGKTESAPSRAQVLVFTSTQAALFDDTLDVSGQLLVEGGPAPALMAAQMVRSPSRSVKEPRRSLLVQGRFYFPVPTSGGKVTGAVLRFHRRPAESPAREHLIPGLPIPGR